MDPHAWVLVDSETVNKSRAAVNTKFSAQNFLSEFLPLSVKVYLNKTQQELLDMLVGRCIEFLDSSARVTGLDVDQIINERWLLKVLRGIYKIDTKAFSEDQIMQLKQLAQSGHERVPAFISDKKVLDGMSVVTRYGFFLKMKVENGSVEFFRDETKVNIDGLKEKTFDYHNLFVCNLLKLHSVIDSNVNDQLAARLIVDQLPLYAREIVIQNFNFYREKNKLLPAVLIRSEKLRKTTCYACGHKLESSIQLECSVCSWLVCDCGACGCGYSD